MKPYIKPELFFESYELSQHIAACRWDLTYNTEDTCVAIYDPLLLYKASEAKAADMTGMYLFQSDGCNIDPSFLEGYCYMNGADNVNRVYQS